MRLSYVGKCSRSDTPKSRDHVDPFLLLPLFTRLPRGASMGGEGWPVMRNYSRVRGTLRPYRRTYLLRLKRPKSLMVPPKGFTGLGVWVRYVYRYVRTCILVILLLCFFAHSESFLVDFNFTL